jgi:hypothetical protein
MKQAYRSASENADCSWLNSKMEELFSDALPPAERDRANAHLAACPSCREEVESLRAIDPLIQKVLRYRTALAAAPAPRRLHVGRALGTATAALCAVALAIVLVMPRTPTDTSAATGFGVMGEVKVAEEREKPDGPVRVLLAPKEEEPTNAPDKSVQKSAPERAQGFAVMDAARYEKRLSDFRGQILLIGVLAPKQPKAAANLERLYRTFGTQLRLLAIAESRRDPAPINTPFQIYYNNGSDLLGTNEAEYAIVDRAGTVVSKGTLIGEPTAIVNAVAAAIKTLETR